MPSEAMNVRGAKMLRFLTPTEAWAARVGNAVIVPAESCWSKSLSPKTVRS